MANNILFIDAGNSTIKWAQYEHTDLSEVVSLAYEENITVDSFIEQWKQLDVPIKVIASCVASDSIWTTLVKACNELWGRDVQRVFSLDQGFGLINAYNNPADLGSDRWCAMIGALQVAESDFIVVDAGSALTIDVVDVSGQHLGGYITPGLNMMRKSLGRQTAQINIDMPKDLTPSLSPATSTAECIESGIILSAVKLIEAVYEKESKLAIKIKCYLTGGDAKLIANMLSIDCVILPDLVLRGLIEIQKNT